MNIFRKIYCRVYQAMFRMVLPFLPYRKPFILSDNEHIVRILKRDKFDSVIIVTDKGIRNLGLTKALEEAIAKANIKLCVFDGTVPNPTTENVNEALELFKSNKCQAIIAVGGGSAMDCAKAMGALVANPKKTLAQMKGILKVKNKLPDLFAIPTTAGTGSETTLAAVITDSKTRHKYAINDFPLIPKYAMLDASLTVGLPKSITATTGMDALTHAVEAYIGQSTTKSTRADAKAAVKIVFENLTTVYKDGSNIIARESMLFAAFKAGCAFTKSYVGYVHAVAHSLGGKYNIAHGLANAIILPYVLKKYGKSVQKKLWELGVYCGLFDKSVSKAEGAKLFIEKIEDMNKFMGIGNTIEQIDEADISELARLADKEANPLYPVPKLFSAKELETIYREVKFGL